MLGSQPSVLTVSPIAPCAKSIMSPKAKSKEKLNFFRIRGNFSSAREGAFSSTAKKIEIFSVDFAFSTAISK